MPTAVTIVDQNNNPPGSNILLLDYLTGTNPIYVGEAAPGTAVGSAGWKIKKLTYDANGNVTAVKLAGGGMENQVWSDRTGLTYA